MSETVVYECGHCEGKGVCERGSGRWSCVTCFKNEGWALKRENSVKCSILGLTH